MTKGNDDESASRPVKDQTGFFLRAVKSPEHRQRIVAVLFPDSKDAHHWWFRFSVMMGLSVMIAVMGLSLNSVAVVIGAMLIAPLMTPVLGISAAIVMGWFGRLRNAVVLVALGSIGSVAISWAVTSVLPSSDRILTAEVLSRTSPDLRDLIVALAAGAAGAYATSRGIGPAAQRRGIRPVDRTERFGQGRAAALRGEPVRDHPGRRGSLLGQRIRTSWTIAYGFEEDPNRSGSCDAGPRGRGSAAHLGVDPLRGSGPSVSDSEPDDRHVAYPLSLAHG